MKKLSIEFIKDFCKSRNIKLLSTEYKKAKENLEFECEQGHKFIRTWDTFKKRNECPICIGHSSDKEYHLNSLKELAKKNNHILLSEKYLKAHSKYSFKCLTHNHVFSISATHYKSGKLGCSYCANKLNQTDIKKEIIKNSLKHNFKILNYVEGCKNKSLIECKCGNTLNVLNDNLKRYFTNCKSCCSKDRGLYSDKYFIRNPTRKNLKAFLYIVFLEDFKTYKVGITATKLKTRLRKLPRHSLVKVYTGKLINIYKLETNILNKFQLKNNFKFAGHTECISADIDNVIQFADKKFRELGGTLSETIPSQATE